ncbi:TnpV protein [Agathobacter rectalis]|uniref:TnpV protein n=1 Tax=Agathobacter rectalis TaxID=39491 RepID=UPI00156F63DE|nr:TnpV protein [Agathobacter rectalis]
MELEYIKAGDYEIPNLIPNQEPQEPLTKFGLMHRTWLKKNYRAKFDTMLLLGELQEHCLKVQKRAQDEMDRIVPQMKKQEGVTEQLKMQDQLKWIRMMNSILNRAEEIVRDTVVYTL